MKWRRTQRTSFVADEAIRRGLMEQKVGTSTANRANRIWRGTKRKERRNRASEVFGNSGKKK